MSKRNLATMDAFMFTPVGRLLQQAFAHGINCDIIHGGLEVGQTSLQGIYETNVTQNCELGTKLREVSTGREFIYSQAGTVILYKALMTESLPVVANYVEQVQTNYAWAAGASSGTVLITTGATPAANYFKDGWMVVNKVTGIGQCYPIATSGSHATILAVALKTGHTIQIATDATSEITLVRNPFKGTIVAPVTTLTAPPAGVPLIQVAIGYFFWAQVKGPCAMTVDAGEGALTIGEPVGSPGTNGTAGAVGIGTTTEGHYGRAMTTGQSDETILVNLDLGL